MIKTEFRSLLFISTIVLFFSCNGIGDKAINSETVNRGGQEGDGGIELIDYSSDFGRLSWQKPELVIQSLGDIKGKKIADIGAGTGYFTFRFNKQGAQVLAIDVNPELMRLVEIFRENLDSLSQTQIETRLVPTDDPKLKEGEVDIAVLINTIGYLNDKTDYLRKVKKGIKQGGVLMIVDFKKNIEIPQDIAPAIPDRLSHLEIQDMLLNAGFELIRVNDTILPYQYIIWALV